MAFRCIQKFVCVLAALLWANLSVAFCQGDDPEAGLQAGPAAVLHAARTAHQAGDWAVAEQLLAQLAESPAGFGGGRLEGECQQELMICRIQLGDFEGAMAAATGASEVYSAIGDQAAAAQTMSALGGLMRAAGQPEYAATAYAGALKYYDMLGDRAGMASVRLSLGIIADLRGQLAEATVHFDEALLLFRQLGDEQSVALCYRNRAYALLRMDQPEEAISAYQQSLYIYNELGLDAPAARTHEELGAAFCEQGDFAAALMEYEQGAAYWLAQPDHGGETGALAGIGIALAGLGRYNEAYDKLRGCFDSMELSGDFEGMAILLPYITDVLQQTGQEQLVEEYRQRLQNTSEASSAAGSPAAY